MGEDFIKCFQTAEGASYCVVFLFLLGSTILTVLEAFYLQSRVALVKSGNTSNSTHNEEMLKNGLVVESSVNIIAGYFYYKFIEIKASGKASFDQLIGMRFADWFLTTPLMLLSLVYLMRVNDASERYRCSQSDSPALCENRVFDSSTIPTLISLNMAMLVFGVVFVYTDSPVNWIAYFASVASFVVLSWIAKTRLYDETITPFPAIFVLFVVLWGLYSFAILFGKYNVFGGQIGLNVLDMLSKGAFGVYLYFLSTNTLT